MCFHIDSNYPKRLEAMKDIVCYKHLSPGNKLFQWVSPWQDSEYKIGKLKRSRLGWLYRNYGIINRGLHAYSTLEKAKGGGEIQNVFIFEAIIPKGAKYFYSEKYEEYVSNKLIVKKQIHDTRN